MEALGKLGHHFLGLLFEKDIDGVLCFLVSWVAASLLVGQMALGGLEASAVGSSVGGGRWVEGVFDVVVAGVVVERVLDPLLDGRLGELAHEDVPVIEVRVAATVWVL